jgi:hypothetical protein
LFFHQSSSPKYSGKRQCIFLPLTLVSHES